MFMKGIEKIIDAILFEREPLVTGSALLTALLCNCRNFKHPPKSHGRDDTAGSGNNGPGVQAR